MVEEPNGQRLQAKKQCRVGKDLRPEQLKK